MMIAKGVSLFNITIDASYYGNGALGFTQTFVLSTDE